MFACLTLTDGVETGREFSFPAAFSPPLVVGAHATLARLGLGPLPSIACYSSPPLPPPLRWRLCSLPCPRVEPALVCPHHSDSEIGCLRAAGCRSVGVMRVAPGIASLAMESGQGCRVYVACLQTTPLGSTGERHKLRGSLSGRRQSSEGTGYWPRFHGNRSEVLFTTTRCAHRGYGGSNSYHLWSRRVQDQDGKGAVHRRTACMCCCRALMMQQPS